MNVQRISRRATENTRKKTIKILQNQRFQANQVILKMPFKNNYGYWIDNNLVLNDFRK